MMPDDTRRNERIKSVSRWILPGMIVVALLWDLVPFVTRQKQDTISYFIAQWTADGWVILPAFCGALCGHWFAPTYWGTGWIRMVLMAAALLVALAFSVWGHYRPHELPTWAPAGVCLIYAVLGSALWPNEIINRV
jgi:hypothetical protein